MTTTDAVTAWQSLAAFLTGKDFLTNFFANLGGALFGVWLGFWIERRRAKHSAAQLYGDILLSVRSELAYLRPLCVSARDRLKAVGNLGVRQSFRIAATEAAMLSPTFHQAAPYSLVMALTAVNLYARDVDQGLHEGVTTLRSVSRKDPGAQEAITTLLVTLAKRTDELQDILGLALERIGLELTRLGRAIEPDDDTQEVSRRLLAILKQHDSQAADGDAGVSGARPD